MQTGFREQVSRFTMARNYSGGSYVLITAVEDEDSVKAEVKGNDADRIFEGLYIAIDTALRRLDNITAVNAREKIKQAIIADEQRRFNAGTNEE